VIFVDDVQDEEVARWSKESIHVCPIQPRL
jgi:hypothetical protein